MALLLAYVGRQNKFQDNLSHFTVGLTGFTLSSRQNRADWTILQERMWLMSPADEGAMEGSIEKAEDLLRSGDDNKVVAGLLVASQLLKRGSTSPEVGVRILDAVPRGLLRRLMKTDGFSEVGLNVATSLASLTASDSDKLLEVVKAMDIEKHDKSTMATLCVTLCRSSRRDFVLSSGKMADIWLAIGRSGKLNDSSVGMEVGSILCDQWDSLPQVQKTKFCSGIQIVLGEGSKADYEDDTWAELLRFGSVCATHTSGIPWCETLIKVFAKNPASNSRKGALRMFIVSVRSGTIGNSVDSWKAVELALRLGDVELRVHLREFLEYDLNKGKDLDNELIVATELCAISLETIEVTCELLLRQEGTLENASVELSSIEKAEVRTTKTLVESMKVIFEFTESLQEMESDKGLETSQIGSFRVDMAIAVSRVVSCFLQLYLPVVEKECAATLQTVASWVDDDNLFILLPGLLVLSEKPGLRRGMVSAGLHLRLARYVVGLAGESLHSDHALDSAMMALAAANLMIDTGTALGPDALELREVADILRPAMRTGIHSDLADMMEELLVADELNRG